MFELILAEPDDGQGYESNNFPMKNTIKLTLILRREIAGRFWAFQKN